MDNIIIKRAQIRGLWNRYNVDLTLNEDVNILVGDNGVGKTTILDIIISILSNNLEAYGIDRKYYSAQIELTNGYEVRVICSPNSILRPAWTKDGAHISHAEVPIALTTVSNIDTAFYPESFQLKLKSAHSDIRTELDMLLYDTIDDYYRYKSWISTTFRKLVKEGQIDEANHLYEPMDKAQELFAQLFDDKEWCEEEDTQGTLLFKVKNTGVLLSPSQLSSGEKQLLLLLLSTLCQNRKPCVTIWDEPEISLHITWQQQLIRIMRELNPNMQLIIATHSPSILHEGWVPRAINVNTIKQQA